LIESLRRLPTSTATFIELAMNASFLECQK
jgi:hypothetical protein